MNVATPLKPWDRFLTPLFSGTAKRYVLPALFACLIAGCGWLVWATGGIKFVYAHFMYVPIVLSGLAFGIRGGLVAAAAGGIVLGPFMPVDVATGEMQAVGNWTFRLMMFSFIGLIVGTVSTWFRSQIRKELWANARLQKSRAELLETNEKLRQAQRQLASQERLHALGQMAGGVTHDFNNALTPILGYADILRETPEIASDPKTLRDFADKIVMAARDATEIVARLQSFYRSRDEKEKFAFVAPADLVRECLQLSQPRWKRDTEGRGVTVSLETRFQDDLPELPAIVSELRQALVNLVFNAVDAMPEGGVLTLSCGTDAHGEPLSGGASVMFGKRPSRCVWIEVRDTGMGMEESTLERCVEPFFTTKGEDGTGLGLAMVFGTARRHEGGVEIISRIGTGTAVRLYLPIEQDMVDHPSEQTPKALDRVLTIMVVDDEERARSFLADALGSDGHRVHHYGSGTDALRAMENTPFDLLITDHGNSDLPGPELAQRLKKRHPDTRVILCTGHEWKPSAPPPNLEGIDRVLRKPVDMSALRGALREFEW